MLRLITFVLFVTAFVNSQDLSEPVVTKSGPINGLLQRTIWYQKPFYSFRGIPYAKPPVGELRFKAPVPVEPWSEPLNAFDYGNMCSQRLRQSPPCSEDCLFLNVFVPSVNHTEKLPVLFFIHGGRFTGGSGDDSRYGPDFQIEREIILVTANYRTGILGFMSLGTPDYSGNMGLKDQQLAMKWIYENIEAFGGDKNRITIGGMSSGSQSVGLHQINKKSSKYYNQILSISGTPNSIGDYQKGDHQCLMEIFYNKFHPGRPNLPKLIKFLKKVDVNEITKFTAETVDEHLLPWAPIVEKSNAKQQFIFNEPLFALQKYKKIKKPAYFTITKYEQMMKDEEANYSDSNVVNAYLKDFNIDFPVFGYNNIIAKKPKYLKNLLQRIRDFYFGDYTESSPHQRSLHRIILDSDLYWTYFIEKWIEHHVAISKADTFYHQFSVQTMINIYNTNYGGAGHGDEQCYLFRCRRYNSIYPQFKEYNGRDPECTKIFTAINNLQTLFSNFIKYGNPSHNKDPIEEFKPVQPKGKPNQFNFIDVTNTDYVPGVAPSGNRTQFLDSVVEEMMKLVREHNDTPTKTPIQYQCDAMKGATTSKPATK
ncbi:esterase B1-like [Contarinia nasturtii]|uniref:esterase B1-like n=1 Tax=Contarinia nasturtii TaxID=265458 RepID=UPI0012D40A9C|nr:esterase B1-like [Contarinia nasturtii]